MRRELTPSAVNAASSEDGIEDERALLNGSFAQLFAASFDALLIVDAEDRCCDANRAACELFGRSIAQLKQLPVSDLLRTETATGSWRYVPPQKPELEKESFTIKRADGQRRIVEYSSITVNAQRSIVMLRDITEHQRMAVALAASEELAASFGVSDALWRVRALQNVTDSILNHASEADLVRDLSARLLRSMNSDCAAVYLLDEESGNLGLQAAAPADVGPFLEVRTAASWLWGLGGVDLHRGRGKGEAMALLPPTFRSTVVAAIRTTAGDIIGALLLGAVKAGRFISDHHELLLLIGERIASALERGRLDRRIKDHEERLTVLSRQMVSAQEQERRSIARELHDQIGQTLTALSLNLRKSAQSVLPEAVAASVTAAQGLCQDLIDHVRNLSLDLRPPMLDDLGLLPTLLWHVQRMEQLAALHISFEHSGLMRVAPDLELTLYRVAQEALTNVVRHAKVQEAKLRLWMNSSAIGIQVVDQGIGFDPAAVPPSSTGLAGMHERVVLLGGQFALEAAPGAGTRVTAVFPRT